VFPASIIRAIWRQQAHLKRQKTLTRLHGATTQKTIVSKDDKMSETCGTHGEVRNSYTLRLENLKKINYLQDLGAEKQMTEDPRVIGYEGVDWI
jgi:hypothetical protein